MTDRRSVRCGRPGFHSREEVLLVVGTDGAAGSGLRDGDAEPVDAGQDGQRFRCVCGEVQDPLAAAAHQGRGDLEQPRAEPFGLPLPRVVAAQCAMVCIQATSSPASWTIWHQTWFCAKDYSGNFSRPLGAPPA